MAKKTEDKAEKFVRLAEKRTRRLMDDMRLLGNLSNRSNYSWREKEVERIFDTLERELKVTKRRFFDQGFSLG